MRQLLRRMSFLVLLGACISGCSSDEGPVAILDVSNASPLEESVSDALPDEKRPVVEAEFAVEELPEESAAEAGALDEPETEATATELPPESQLEESPAAEDPIEPVAYETEANDVSATDRAAAVTELPSEGELEEPPNAKEPVELVAEETDPRPLLTRKVIDAYAQLGQKREDADKLLFKHLSNVAAAYNLRRTQADIYEYIVAQIDMLNESEADHAEQVNSPVPVDMKIGRPTAGHRVRGVALPSMRLGLLKYLIDRSRDSDDFEVDAWLDRTREIEKKLANAVEPVFETFPFLQLLKVIEDATEMWAYTNYRVQETDSTLKYGFSISPSGRILFENHGGVLGRATRMGTRAALAHNLEKLDNYRKEYEWAKLDMDIVMGVSLNAALSDSDRTHLEHLWEAKVLLSPKYFYRIRWQSQYNTDLKILNAGISILKAKDKATADLYIERAKLFSLKGSHPYMFYSDLSKASELDPELKLDSEMQQNLDAVIKVLELEDRVYTASVRKELYFDSLRLVDELEGG